MPPIDYPSNYNPYNTSAFQKSYDYFDQAANSALPSPESLDRSLARVRSRVDSTGAAQANTLRDQYAGRGLGFSGGLDNALMRNYAATQGAYSSGAAQAIDDYEKQRQAGAAILNQSGTGLSDAADKAGTLGLKEALGFGDLGIQQGQLALDTQRQEEEARNNKTTNLINLLTSFGAVGNTQGQQPGKTPTPDEAAFNQNFGEIKNALLAYFGIGV